MMQGRAVGLDRSDFRLDRALRHDHVRGNSSRARSECERGTMISRGVRHHTARRRRVGERPYGVACAAKLEGACTLEIFALEEQRCAAQRVEAA